MTARLHILLVDNSELILSRLKMLLSDVKRIGRMETASSIRDARKSIAKQKPDVIILDICLPDGNGILFLKYLKQEYPEVMVVMLTNHSDSFFRDTAERYGADHFFDKSMEFEQVPLLLSEIQN